jgi:hypothetical protein
MKEVSRKLQAPEQCKMKNLTASQALEITAVKRTCNYLTFTDYTLNGKRVSPFTGIECPDYPTGAMQERCNQDWLPADFKIGTCFHHVYAPQVVLRLLALPDSSGSCWVSAGVRKPDGWQRTEQLQSKLGF